MEVEEQPPNHDGSQGDDFAENPNKRTRDNNGQEEEEDLFSSLEESENQSHHRRLKKKKVVEEVEAIESEDSDVVKQEVKPEPENSDEEFERQTLAEQRANGRETLENLKGQDESEDDREEIGEDDDQDGKNRKEKKSDSKQLHAELFADDSSEEGLLSGSELPPDFPDDLSDAELQEARGEAHTQNEVAAYVSDEDFSDEERMGDFIVDAEGKPIRMAKESKRTQFGSGAITGEQLTVAQDVFFGDADPADFFGRDQEGFGYGEEEEDEQAAEEEQELQNRLREMGGGVAEMRQESYRLLAKRLEPSELAEHFASMKDDEIVSTDRPERMQLRTPGREILSPTEESSLHLILQEAEWIYEQAFSERQHLAAIDRETVVKCITQVLRLLLLEHFEIPFIAQYRKEHWNTSNPKATEEEQLQDTSLHVDDLWDIYDWDEKWHQLQVKRSKLLESLRSIEEDGEIPLSNLLSTISAVEVVSDPVELGDYADYFRLHFASTQQKNSNQKLPSKRDRYSLVKRGGIAELAAKFAISADQLGENLLLQFQRNVPIDPLSESGEEQSPLQFAVNSANSNFRSSEDVISSVMHFLATEIGAQPLVRQALRGQFDLHAVLNTRPTEEGKRVIDAFSPFREIKHLQNKPIIEIMKFESPTTRFLKILKASKEGLITFTIDLPGEAYNKLLDSTKAFYVSDLHSSWDEARERILKLAIDDHLLPLFRAQLQEKLTVEGQNAVMSLCEMNLRQLILVGPYKPMDDVHEENEALEEMQPEKKPISVLACYYGSPAEKKATEFVLMGSDGEFKGHLSLTFTPKNRERDLQELRAFIEQHHPTTIAVAAHGFAARHLYADIMSIIGEMERDGQAAPPSYWVDAEVAEIYWSSQEARDEFKRLQQQSNYANGVLISASLSATGGKKGSGQSYNPHFARALSLGRRLLDPLIELSRLCNSKRDICCLSLHSLQDQLNQELLYQRLERVFVTIVNAVGVDINEILREPRKAPLLNFVSGLGMRKATHVLAETRASTQLITSRTQLMKYLGGEVVARNAVGFIKLNRSVLKSRVLLENEAEGSENQAGVELFDMTRIHPDDYGFACKIAKDAIERDDCENCVEEVMKDPSGIDRVDLDLFAQLVLDNFSQSKLHTLYDIKGELTTPFADPREPFVEMEETKLFDLLTGTTEETLYPGMFVKCRILMKKDRDHSRGVSCFLEHSDIMGYIGTNELSDSYIEHPAEVVAADETVLGRINEINKNKFFVRVTCRPSMMTSTKWNPHSNHDPYLIEDPSEDYPHADLINTASDSKKERQLLKRAIVHTRFKNVDRDTAEKLLGADTCAVGDFFFRPSSTSYSNLKLSWKFWSDVIVHIDVKELDKPNNNNWSLGKRLQIEQDFFDDLDDVVANFMETISQFANSVLDHRRFKAGRKGEIDAFLNEGKQVNPQDIPYVLSICYEEPGRFLLAYQPGTRVKREFVTVTPKGLRYRKRYFTTADRLVDYFKRHWKETSTLNHVPDLTSNNINTNASSSTSNYPPFGSTFRR